MKPIEPSPLALESSPGLFWAKDAGHVLVVDEQRQTAQRLSGDEAAIWGWLHLSYPYAKITQMLAELQVSSLDESEQRFAEIIQKWVQVGLLQPAKGTVSE